MTGWRSDMENAPRDGTNFLGWLPFCNGGGAYRTAYWDDEKQAFLTNVYPFLKLRLSHWQPLDPPEPTP